MKIKLTSSITIEKDIEALFDETEVRVWLGDGPADETECSLLSIYEGDCEDQVYIDIELPDGYELRKMK